MKLNKNLVAFTGGGTGGHIYPGLAVCDNLKSIAEKNNKNIQIIWLGCSKGMDRQIVEKAKNQKSLPSADKFYGIPSGKLRRYFSLKNLSDLFRIAGGFFSAFHILRKTKPSILFSKGGFVSVPPCIAARLLKIPVYTHECDFTLGLANRINFKSATKMFVSYEETKKSLSLENQKRVIVTGNPVRPIFYCAKPEEGLKFLNISQEKTKPILLILGGSSGAKQINDLTQENLDYLCKNFIVVHQTGLVNSNPEEEKILKEKYRDDYKPYNFIYEQMPNVLACADLILSRAGANSIWEAAVLRKPMVLIPLCGNGTRGDQVDNAKFFEEKNAAKVLLGKDANSENLIKALDSLKNPDEYAKVQKALENMTNREVAAENIAKLLAESISL